MFDELEEEPRVDLTPLIDVIFMLVIFFVMTMTFSKPVLDVVLPAAQNSEVKKKTTDREPCRCAQKMEEDEQKAA